MGTLKNVDAGDDLMIVSKPKDTIPFVEEKVSTVVKEKKVESGFVDVASAVAFLRSKMESGPSGDISALYALLTSPSGPLAQNVDAPAAEKKQKKEKKEKKDKKDRKSSKDKSKSRHKSSVPPVVEQASTVPIISASSVAPDTTGSISKPHFVGTGDIFGDLLGDEMPKWDILNPTG
jgi:hypothetical protein